ncbi:MAG: hypothetical protein HY706_09115 [Candidatus Hydrogenedentes bacterium]|nr:hypothetical protein [Candidatus Hydrogenedentota bacterium]
MKASRCPVAAVLVSFSLALALGFSPAATADDGPDHQVVQARPIELGTSGGNINDRSKIYCCSGTLGALVQDADGFQYILSNNHVLARTNLGTIGDDVNQPGQIDQNCGQTGVVADLSKFVTIKFKQKRSIPLNEVDAAIALVRDGMVSADGSILDIGPLSANTVAATVGQVVQKSGRTTGNTVGTVAAVNVTVDVGYSKSCGGANNQVARYINQIRITPGAFSAGGDSGSTIVEADAVDPTDGLPRAVGLLFAGSSTSTIANPINRVLTLLGVATVGGGSVAASSSSPEVVAASSVKGRHSAKLFAVPGVVGHGVSVGANGKPVIEVYLEQDSASSRVQIPAALENVPVKIEVTGPFEAF